ncbi:uncharacterized protein LOC122196859 isoform X2 [Lactuca sativa]|nr:uncharacterized protein LOC122196859 isoform X2 [Lactuca sativa]
MEDIEDLLVGGGAAPPGFRIPITAVVGINPIKKKKNNKLEPSSLLQNSSTHQVPGTQTIFFEDIWMFTQPGTIGCRNRLGVLSIGGRPR